MVGEQRCEIEVDEMGGEFGDPSTHTRIVITGELRKCCDIERIAPSQSPERRLTDIAGVVDKTSVNCRFITTVTGDHDVATSVTG